MRPGALSMALIVAAAAACGRDAASGRAPAPTFTPALVHAPPPPPPPETCGSSGQPPCPLRMWMKANAAPAVRSRDFDALASALERIATFAPPGYPNWVSIARDGASAARAQSLDAVEASCRSCHEQYEDRYQSQLRGRPL